MIWRWYQMRIQFFIEQCSIRASVCRNSCIWKKPEGIYSCLKWRKTRKKKPLEFDEKWQMIHHHQISHVFCLLLGTCATYICVDSFELFSSFLTKFFRIVFVSLKLCITVFGINRRGRCGLRIKSIWNLYHCLASQAVGR